MHLACFDIVFNFARGGDDLSDDDRQRDKSGFFDREIWKIQARHSKLKYRDDQKFLTGGSDSKAFDVTSNTYMCIPCLTRKRTYHS